MKINNADMVASVRRRQDFTNSNDTAFGKRESCGYVVYSYGTHFPMYVWLDAEHQWFGNSDKYSRTTSRHQAQARPAVPSDIIWADTDTMLKLESCARGCRDD